MPSTSARISVAPDTGRPFTRSDDVERRETAAGRRPHDLAAVSIRASPATQRTRNQLSRRATTR
jgi:hypothetical protein